MQYQSIGCENVRILKQGLKSEFACQLIWTGMIFVFNFKHFLGKCGSHNFGSLDHVLICHAFAHVA